VALDFIDTHKSNIPVTKIIIPVPPSASPLGIPVVIAIMYGITATTARNGAPIILILFKTLVI